MTEVVETRRVRADAPGETRQVRVRAPGEPRRVAYLYIAPAFLFYLVFAFGPLAYGPARSPALHAYGW